MPRQKNLNKPNQQEDKFCKIVNNSTLKKNNNFSVKNQPQHIYTVSELTQDLKLIIESSFTSIWLEGEISNFTHHLSGHMYFSLKDKNAVISACLFKNVNQRIKFKLEDGLSVICFGQITVYGKRGQYQIVIERIEPKGMGALQLAFEQLKERLFREGLFDSIHKKPIPVMPFCVGVVTSVSGAAVRDILEILTTEAGFLRLILRPTMVQGKEAKYDIAQAIAEFNQFSQADVLIVGRGGGSLEDLWAFNEEEVARAIFNSQIPIISAVGHEVDTTIADLVADLRAPTPSAAAKIIAHKKKEVLRNLAQSCLLLSNALREKVRHLQERFNLISTSPALRHPLQRIEEFQQDVDNLTRSVFLATQHIVQIAEDKLVAVSGKFQALNPISILARGFSLTTTLNGKIVKQADYLKKGELVNTKLAKGSFQSEVKQILDK
ncbi:MAG: exodeoxyribonuclease VII large subunit [Candidatus Omnitrophota bacterium]|jgi:exodeoxyribonuclease VII large subunit